MVVRLLGGLIFFMLPVVCYMYLLLMLFCFESFLSKNWILYEFNVMFICSFSWGPSVRFRECFHYFSLLICICFILLILYLTCSFVHVILFVKLDLICSSMWFMKDLHTHNSKPCIFWFSYRNTTATYPHDPTFCEIHVSLKSNLVDVTIARNSPKS